MTERILSPDGTQYWNGSTWLPVEDLAPAGAAAFTGETGAGDENTAIAAATPGLALDTSNPNVGPGKVPPASYPLQGAAPSDNSWAFTKWAWLLAVSPLVAGVALGPIVLLTLPGSDDLVVGDFLFASLGLLVLAGCTAACAADVKSLRRRGVSVDQSFTAAVLLLYVVGAPAYLIYRTVKARSTWLVPATWFAAVAFAFAGGYIFTSEDGTFRNPIATTPALDVPALESDLAAELRDLGARGVDVDCPDEEAYADGDMVICDVSTKSDGPLEIVMDMHNDGYYMWEVQQP
jgi:hypothetical protein